MVTMYDVPGVCEGDEGLHEGGGDGAVVRSSEGVDEAQEGLAKHELQFALVVRPCKWLAGFY